MIPIRTLILAKYLGGENPPTIASAMACEQMFNPPIPSPINFDTRKKLLKPLFGNKIPIPFKGAAEKYWGSARKSFPKLTPSQARKMLEKVRSV